MRHVRLFIAQPSTSSSQNIDHAHADAGEPEEGEAMEAMNEDDEAMMAIMGMTGFGSTKVLASAPMPCFLIVIPLARVSMSPGTKTVRLM